MCLKNEACRPPCQQGTKASLSRKVLLSSTSVVHSCMCETKREFKAQVQSVALRYKDKTEEEFQSKEAELGLE